MEAGNVNRIRAVFNEESIRVYQAYNDKIADEALRLGTFGSSFNTKRMTWIKPSFLWMMYRSGWGTKENQERILGIDIKRSAFDYLCKNAVESKYNPNVFVSEEDWKTQVKESEIRVQWDPERDIFGNPQSDRSIQLGIRGKCVEKYIDEWILRIEDITDYVGALRGKMQNNEDITRLLPNEQIYLF